MSCCKNVDIKSMRCHPICHIKSMMLINHHFKCRSQPWKSCLMLRTYWLLQASLQITPLSLSLNRTFQAYPLKFTRQKMVKIFSSTLNLHSRLIRWSKTLQTMLLSCKCSLKFWHNLLSLPRSAAGFSPSTKNHSFSKPNLMLISKP